MKNILYLTKMIVMAITLVMVISCDEDENDNIIDPSNGIRFAIFDFVTENPDYSILLEGIQLTGLDTLLASNTNFTLFAPNNEAFTNFLDGSALSDIDVDTLEQLLLNHIIGTTLASEQLTTGYVEGSAIEPTTGANLDLFIDITAGIRVNGQSTVVTPDIQTDNGIIHAVDNVLDIPTLLTFINANTELSSLLTALTDEGNTAFTDVLGNVTTSQSLFAPDNSAFESFLDGSTLDAIDNDVLTQLLSNHVLNDTIAVSSLLSTDYITTSATYNNDPATPLSLYVNVDSGLMLNGSVGVTQTDVVAINGVIHITDGVIDLPDVTTFIMADPNLASLNTALSTDSFTFLTTLQTPDGTSPAPFTVFAPSNDAFTGLLTDLGESDLADVPAATLEDILELHILTNANIRAANFMAIEGMPLTTLGGGLISVEAMTPSVIDPDGGANVITTTDIQATNGVIHQSDRVLRDF